MMIAPVLQRFVLTSAQTSLIVALQRLLQASGLILVCPACLAEGASQVSGDVSTATETWHLTCRCRDRVMRRADVMDMDADADLFESAARVLGALRLAIRCPEPTCVGHPLDVTLTDAALTVRCPCAKTTFPRRPQTRH